MITVRTLIYSNRLSKHFYESGNGEYVYKKEDAANVIANITLDIIISMSRCTEGLHEITKDYCNRNLLANISADISRHLSASEAFNLDGYICFRSREHLQRINTFLMYVYKRISIQEKRDNIIDDLKKYVSCCKPEKELVYLDHTGSRIEIFDMNYNRLMPEAVRLYAVEYGSNDDDVLVADIVLHYLLKTLPQMIFIKIRHENAFIQTLKKVFEDRVLLLQSRQ